MVGTLFYGKDDCMQKKERLALLAAILGNGIFGFSFMFSRMALSVAHPFVLLMYRFSIAFVLISLIALWAHRSRQEGWLRFRLTKKDILSLLPLGICQPVVYFLCESHGISMTNATFSGVIIALIPIAALAFGAVFLREIPKLTQVLFALVSIFGVILMTLQQSSQGEIQPLGVVLLLGAVLSAVVFNLMSRKTSEHFSALERTWVMMGVGAIAFTCMALFYGAGQWQVLTEPLKHAPFLIALGYLGTISSIVAFLMLNYANAELPVARTTIFANLTTVISLFAGVVFLGEPFGWLSLVASVIIIGGIWGVQKA